MLAVGCNHGVTRPNRGVKEIGLAFSFTPGLIIYINNQKSKIMSIFSNRVYRGKWVESERHTITEEDIRPYKAATLVPSEYGMSVCLTLRSGGYEYTPVSNKSRAVSDIKLEDLKGASLVTLSRDGDDDIKRIEF